MKKIFVILILLWAMSVNAQWQKMFERLTTINEFTGNSTYVFCATAPTGIFRSSNNGLTWDTVNTGLASKYVWTITAQGSYIFAGTDSGLFRSTNNGNNWSSIHNNIFKKYVFHLACDDQFIYAGTVVGICRSTDHGITWDSINNGLPKDPHSNSTVNIGSLTVTNNYVWTSIQAVIYGIPRLYRSSNNGNNWIPVIYSGMDSISVYSLLAKDSILLCGTHKGVYISRNSGITWRLIPEISINIGMFAFSIIDEKNMMIGHYGNGVYVSTNGGINWFTRNEGLYPGEYKSCALYSAGNYTYLGTRPFDTYLPAIFRRPTQQIIPVIENNTKIPEDIELYQNYPNPFNPSTKIRFDIPRWRGEGGWTTTLKVYDVMGREVQTLVNESLKPGTYETSFDGSQLTSGVYFYKLTTDGFSETKKMIMIK